MSGTSASMLMIVVGGGCEGADMFVKDVLFGVDSGFRIVFCLEEYNVLLDGSKVEWYVGQLEASP